MTSEHAEGQIASFEVEVSCRVTFTRSVLACSRVEALRQVAAHLSSQERIGRLVVPVSGGSVQVEGMSARPADDLPDTPCN